MISTADRTLIGNYHRDEFLGFGTTAPPNVVSEWFFKALFFSLIARALLFVKIIERKAKSVYTPPIEMKPKRVEVKA